MASAPRSPCQRGACPARVGQPNTTSQQHCTLLIPAEATRLHALYEHSSTTLASTSNQLRPGPHCPTSAGCPTPRGAVMLPKPLPHPHDRHPPFRALLRRPAARRCTCTGAGRPPAPAGKSHAREPLPGPMQGTRGASSWSRAGEPLPGPWLTPESPCSPPPSPWPAHDKTDKGPSGVGVASSLYT